MRGASGVGAGAIALAVLAVVAIGLAGHGSLMASGEEALLREVSELAAASPLVSAGTTATDRDRGAAPPKRAERASASTCTGPPEAAPVSGAPREELAATVIAPGSTADLAVNRAVQFLMSAGCIDQGRCVVQLLARGAIHVGRVPAGGRGFAVPERCVRLPRAEIDDPDRGLPRTVSLARALLTGVHALPAEGPDGAVSGPVPGPVDAWSRTLDMLSAWVRTATRRVHEASAGGAADRQMVAWRALVLVEEMRAALRDYRTQGYCGDTRADAWESLHQSLGRTRRMLREKLGLAV
jgi:hypothetical protein